jgi:hypothetical protein
VSLWHDVPVPPARSWTRERIIDALQEWMANGGDGRVAGYHDYLRDHDAPADTTITRAFGGCREALIAAGIEPLGGSYRSVRTRSRTPSGLNAHDTA